MQFLAWYFIEHIPHAANNLQDQADLFESLEGEEALHTLHFFTPHIYM